MTETVWTSAQLSTALGVEVPEGINVEGISIDTRTLQPGDMFIAFTGEKVDGHQFVDEAFAKGAAAALVSQQVHHPNAIMVDDVQAALERLARARRNACAAPCIAITGSVGKTSTKEMLSHCLATAGKTHATAGNYNNQLGLPITMASMPLDTEYAVFELGMNHAGELTALSGLLQPNAVMITTIAPQHLEFFDSVEDIAKAKAEMCAGVKEGGVAILPGDSKYYSILEQAAQTRGLQVKTFGAAKTMQCQLVTTQATTSGQEVRAQLHEKQVAFSIGCLGEHHALNALGVLLVLEQVGQVQAIEALRDYKATKGRGELHKLTLGEHAFTLVDESYNAGPSSMQASLALLGEMQAQQGGKALAMLGDMLELGEDEAQFHASLAEPIHKAGIDAVFTVGERMRNLAAALPEAVLVGQTDSVESLLGDALLELITDYDVVMIKGSNGSQCWKLVDYILERSTRVL